MRKEDLASLNVKYTDGPDADDHRFAKAIGVSLPNIRTLRAEIFNDFDTKVCGVGWWAHHQRLDKKLRILISDQLWQSLSSVQDNVIEAKLHLLELLDLWDQEDRLMKNAVQIVNGEPRLLIPERAFAKDDLPNHFADMHLKGLFGSLSSSIDCVAAGIVGVMGVRQRLIETGYSGLRRHLRQEFNYANEAQKNLPVRLDEIESSAGPSGWLTWLLDYRNMALHRGRRIRMSQVSPRPAGVLTHRGEDILRTDINHTLVSNPAVSEIESLKDRFLQPLTERGEVTLNEVIKSTTFFIEEVAKYLIDAWKARRENPTLIEQPAEQWPKIRDGEHRAFSGYEPGSLNVRADTIYSSEAMVTRMRAASLDGDNIEFWKK